MLRLVTFFFICLQLLSLPLMAEPVLWPIDFNTKGEATLLGEFTVEKFGKAPLYPKLQAGSKDYEVYDLLNRYYTYMAKQQMDKLPAMFADADNSKDFFVKALNQRPGRYKGFSALEKADALSVIKWGDYKIANVYLQTPKKSMWWREILLCDGPCKLSRVLNTVDENREKFAIMNGSFTQSSKTRTPQQLRNEYLPTRKKLINNATYFFTQWETAQGNKKYPLILYPDIKLLPLLTINIENTQLIKRKISDDLKNGLLNFVAFLKELKKIRLVYSKDTLLPSTDLDKVYKRYWSGYSNRGKARFFSTTEVNGGLTPGLVSGGYYLPMAYARTLASWDQISVVGYYQSASTMIIYFYPIEGNKRLGIQAVSVDVRGRDARLSFAVQDSAIGKLLLSSELVGLLSNRTQ